MTEEERVWKSISRWVTSKKNKVRRIYFWGLAELIVYKYDIQPYYTSPMDGFEKINPDGTFKLKEGVKQTKTNHSHLTVKNPDYQFLALVKACEDNPYSLEVKGRIGVPISFMSLQDNFDGKVEEVRLSINNILFNGLCKEANIPYELEEVEEKFEQNAF